MDLCLDSDRLRHKPQIHQLLEQDKHLLENRYGLFIHK